MKHKVKVTVIDKKIYPELQEKYCADPKAGMCPCYNVGDEFIFERDEENDHFWHGGMNTLVKTSADPNTVAGGRKCHIALRHGMPFHDIYTPVCKVVQS